MHSTTPGMECARNPIASICSQTARTCSSVAFDCITTSMGGSLEQRRNGKFSLFRGREAKTLYRRRIEYFGGAGRDRTADKGSATLSPGRFSSVRLVLRLLG